VDPSAAADLQRSRKSIVIAVNISFDVHALHIADSELGNVWHYGVLTDRVEAMAHSHSESIQEPHSAMKNGEVELLLCWIQIRHLPAPADWITDGSKR